MVKVSTTRKAIEKASPDNLNKTLLELLRHNISNIRRHSLGILRLLEGDKNGVEVCKGCNEVILDNQSRADDRHSTCV